MDIFYDMEIGDTTTIRLTHYSESDDEKLSAWRESKRNDFDVSKHSRMGVIDDVIFQLIAQIAGKLTEIERDNITSDGFWQLVITYISDVEKTMAPDDFSYWESDVRSWLEDYYYNDTDVVLYIVSHIKSVLGVLRNHHGYYETYTLKFLVAQDVDAVSDSTTYARIKHERDLLLKFERTSDIALATIFDDIDLATSFLTKHYHVAVIYHSIERDIINSSGNHTI